MKGGACTRAAIAATRSMRGSLSRPMKGGAHKRRDDGDGGPRGVDGRASMKGDAREHRDLRRWLISPSSLSRNLDEGQRIRAPRRTRQRSTWAVTGRLDEGRHSRAPRSARRLRRWQGR